jgi:hypothetical protein
METIEKITVINGDMRISWYSEKDFDQIQVLITVDGDEYSLCIITGSDDWEAMYNHTVEYFSCNYTIEKKDFIKRFRGAVR